MYLEKSEKREKIKIVILYYQNKHLSRFLKDREEVRSILAKQAWAEDKF